MIKAHAIKRRSSQCSAVIRVQESKLREGVTFGPQRGRGGTRQNRRGGPNFEFLLHFYVTISKILSIL